MSPWCRRRSVLCTDYCGCCSADYCADAALSVGRWEDGFSACFDVFCQWVSLFRRVNRTSYIRFLRAMECDIARNNNNMRVCFSRPCSVCNKAVGFSAATSPHKSPPSLRRRKENSRNLILKGPREHLPKSQQVINPI